MGQPESAVLCEEPGCARGELIAAARSAMRLYGRVMGTIDDECTLKVREAIIDQSDELAQIHTSLTELARATPGAQPSRLMPVIHRLAECAADVRAQADDMDKPFSIFITGMGKFGKSTLLNALAAAELARVDFLPNTWRIDVFDSTAPADQVRIVSRDGSVRMCSVAEARRIVDSEEEKTTRSRSLVEKKMMEDFTRLTDAKARDQRREQLRRELQYVSPVVEVHWPTPRTGVLKSFRLVDTPGLSQDLLPKTVRASFEDYYYKADGVVWVLAADKISADEPMRIMRERMSEVGAGRSGGAGQEGIIAVLNKIDLVGPPASPMRARALEEARRLFGAIFTEIIPFSAREAWEAARSGDRNMAEASGLNALLDAVGRRFKRRAAHGRREHKMERVRMMMGNAVADAERYRRVLESDAAARRELEEAFSKAVQTARMGIETILDSAGNHILAGASSKLEALADELWDATTGQERQEIMKRILNPESAARFMNQAGAESQLRVKQLSQVWIRQSRMTEFNYLPEEFNPLVIRPEDVNPGMVYHVKPEFFLQDVFAHIISFLAGNFSLIRGLIKPLAFPGFKRNVYGQCCQAVDSMKTTAMSSADESIAKLCTAVSEVRDGSFASLHCRVSDIDGVLQYLTSLGRIAPIQEPNRTGVRQMLTRGLASNASRQ